MVNKTICGNDGAGLAIRVEAADLPAPSQRPVNLPAVNEAPKRTAPFTRFPYVLIACAAIPLGGCVIMTRRAWKENVALAADIAYAQGLTACNEMSAKSSKPAEPAPTVREEIEWDR